MASAVASNLPPAAAPAYGWLSPRVSFSHDAQGADVMEPAAVSSPAAVAAMAVATPEPAISKDFIDFEFSLGGSATMLPADELFADGKLLPLRKAAAPLPDTEAAAAAPPPPARAEAAMPAPAGPVKPLRAAAVAAADGTADPYVFSPKAPSCSSRWRELLGLKRAAAAQSPSAKPSPSPAAAARTPAARAANSAAARSLKLLLQRNTGRASGASATDLASAPLLRDSSDSEASLSLASSRFSFSSSSSSSGHEHDDVPRLSLDSAADPNPPRIRLVRSSHHRHSTSGSTRAGRSPARRRPSPPPPPRCLSVDSPRMNSSGKIVFQGLERSSSSPCSFHAASKSRSRAVDRSYSSGVRVAPVVLNVPVCSRPVFGFFKDKKDSAAAKDASAAAAAAAARSRSALGRKAQGWSGELPRSSG
ncbi:flocculation protein FLO11-like [Panicum miliaceum]|uniref:Flocculation protein FLO11-like n=1 Tax=Panicum miliaceum TaxID=4540 RepID=A0A3L6PDS4_PANMI|nr:flocculation protein FLO11-like [Panicum miliaceum]